MFANKRYPEILYPHELDAYLAEGWYRMGQTIFTTHFLYFGQNVYSAIWIRLELETYEFRKSLRKLIRKNLERFNIKISQGYISKEKEVLFQKYKRSFDGKLAQNLKEYLLDGEDYNIFNTYEVSIYDGKKLVGFSFFDIGAESVASISGIYDPEYQQHSLGFFTMLMEIQYCLENNLKYYYPGYVVPGYSRFDYKLRVGDVTYYQPESGAWLPFNELSEERIPINLSKQKLEELCQSLKRNKIEFQLLTYPFFEANLFQFWQALYFDFPILVHIPVKNSTYFKLVATFDIKQLKYNIIKCLAFDDTLNYFNKDFINNLNPKTHFNEILIIESVLSIEESTKACLKIIKKYLLEGFEPEPDLNPNFP